MNPGEDIYDMFLEFKKAFERKIDKEYHISVQYDIYTHDEMAIIQVRIVNGYIEIFFGEQIQVEEILEMTYETLKKLYAHELTMITAMSSSKGENGVTEPLIKPKESNQERIIYLNSNNSVQGWDFAKRLHIMDEFFNKETVSIAKVDSLFCRRIHDVNAIGLFSDFEKGVLHIYFEIREGETLREPPVPFSIFVLQGRGIVKCSQEKIEIENKTYYHMVPGTPVEITNCGDECLKLLYLGQR